MRNFARKWNSSGGKEKFIILSKSLVAFLYLREEWHSVSSLCRVDNKDVKYYLIFLECSCPISVIRTGIPLCLRLLFFSKRISWQFFTLIGILESNIRVSIRVAWTETLAVNWNQHFLFTKLALLGFARTWNIPERNCFARYLHVAQYFS